MHPRCPRIDPAAALAAGLTVVTPNNRLARTLVARHDAAMLRAGKRTWSAARALPWSAWLGHAVARSARGERRCRGAATPVRSRSRLPLAADRVRRPGDRHGAPRRPAAAAARGDAWELVHAWGAGGESWRAWRDTPAAPAGSDVENFARWAERYQQELATREVIDLATLADVLVAAAPAMKGWSRRVVVFAGFIEFSPQQDRLIAALRAAGMRIDITASEVAEPAIERVVAPTAHDELLLALEWARKRVDAEPGRAGRHRPPGPRRTTRRGSRAGRGGAVSRAPAAGARRCRASVRPFARQAACRQSDGRGGARLGRARAG